VCVVSCLPQQKLKFKQSKRANQQQQQQPSMIANFAASVTAGVAASCWSFTNSTSRRRLSLSLSSFLQLCLLPTNTDIHTHAHTHTLTFYARLLLWLLLFRRLHTHFYAMLCSFALLQRAPALSLSLSLFCSLSVIASLCCWSAAGPTNVFAFGLFVATLWVLLQLPLLLCCLDM